TFRIDITSRGTWLPPARRRCTRRFRRRSRPAAKRRVNDRGARRLQPSGTFETHMREILFATIALTVAVAAPGGRREQPRPPEKQAIEILPVHGSIYMIAGAGGNITASVGRDGVLLVDSGLATVSDQVLDAVRQLQRQVQAKEPPFDMRWGAETRGTLQNSLNPVAPPKPIRYIINTHFH